MRQIEFRKHMNNGQASEPVTGWLFTIDDEAFVTHKIGQTWRVTHYRTGLCVESRGDTTRDGTVQGFRDCFKCGIKSMAKLKAGAKKYATMNEPVTA